MRADIRSSAHVSGQHRRAGRPRAAGRGLRVRTHPVGGDRVVVESIINSPDADPHEYEASPADAAEVGDAAVMIVNGGGFDDFAGRLVEASAGIPVVTVTETLPAGVDDHVTWQGAQIDQLSAAPGRAAA